MEELKILDSDTLLLSAGIAMVVYAVPYLFSYVVKHFFSLMD